MILTACEVADPDRQAIVPGNWGAELQPRHVDVPYLPGGLTGCPGRLTSDEACGGAHNLDIYPATQGGSRGTLVWVHGGGFVSGDKYPMTFVNPIKRLTHLGWSLVSINYRLANEPGGRFPAASQDVAAALRWIRVHGASYGLDTRRLVIGGESAGGTLAALAGTTGNSGNPTFGSVPPLSGWISMAGILDFSVGPMSGVWGTLWQVPTARFAFASPVNWWDPSDPKGWMIHGDQDNVVEYQNTNAMLTRTAFSDRAQRDTVDRYADGGFQSNMARSHWAALGMNSGALLEWLNGLPTLDTTANPIGDLNVVAEQVAGRVEVAGWALDTDSGANLDVHLYVDDRYHSRVRATTMRPDVARAYPLHRTDHGFTTTLDGLAAGNRRVCAYAINTNRGTTNPLLGCRTVTVRPWAPFGNLDVVRNLGGGGVRVAGWAIDADAPGAAEVDVRVDGVLLTTASADQSRPDVGRAFPAYGPDRGYDVTLTDVTAGIRRICATARNAGPGPRDHPLGCRTVTVTEADPASPGASSSPTTPGGSNEGASTTTSTLPPSTLPSTTLPPSTLPSTTFPPDPPSTGAAPPPPRDPGA